MKHILALRFATVALLAGCLAPPALAAPPLSEPRVRVSFSQLDWLGPHGEPYIDCSPVMVAAFSFGREPAVLGTTAGEGGLWLNVVTHVPEALEPDSWSVRNLYVSYLDIRDASVAEPTVQFGLLIPPGTCLKALEHVVFVSQEPVPLMPFVTDWDRAHVRSDAYLAGGRISVVTGVSGGSAWADTPVTLGDWGWWPPWPPGPPPPPPPLPIATRWAAQNVKGIQPIAELIDGCAPAAAARSITYLMENAGEDPPRPTPMYNGLINEMQTSIDGGGTTDANLQTGKDDYVDGEALPIQPTQLSYGGASFGQAFNNLGNGGNVEALISWNPQPGGGGHVAMVTQMVSYPDGSYDITYVDDPDQSDNRAENAEHVIHVDAGGNFPGGTVDGFAFENHD